jgi:hypothetical protein
MQKYSDRKQDKQPSITSIGIAIGIALLLIQEYRYRLSIIGDTFIEYR